MGGKSRDSVELQIKNEISTRIENYNQNINKLLTETITNVTSNLVNETANSIKASTAGANRINISGGLNLSGKAKFNIYQKVDVQATNEAVFKILTDTKLLASLGNKMNEEIVNKIKNDTAAQQTLKAANELNNAVKNAGGPEGMLANAMGAFSDIAGSLTGKETDKEVSQKIENKLSLNVTTSNINENNIKNIVKNSVETMIKNMTSNSCDIQSAGSNEIIIDGSVVISDEATATFTQISNVVALNKCLAEQLNNSGMQTALTNDTGVVSKTDTSNTSKAEASMDAKNKASNTQEQGSVLTTMFEQMGKFGSIMAIGGIVVIIVIFVLLFKFGGSIFPGLLGVGGIPGAPHVPGVKGFITRFSLRGMLKSKAY
jgi:hypothetical protein